VASIRRREALVSARKAVGLTQEQLADVMRVDRSTVIRWEAGDYAPLPFQWPKLARVLGRSADELRELIDVRPTLGSPMLRAELEPAFSWLDRHVGWSQGTTRGRVEASVPVGPRVRSAVGRSRVADALAGYYGDPPVGYSRYQARCGNVEVQTSVISRPEWTDFTCPLTFQTDRIALLPDVERPRRHVVESAAVRRLAEAAAYDVRIADVPIYRLLEIEAGPDAVVGKVGLVPFVEYALSMDLLERELADSLASGKPVLPGNAPLRDKYLPNFASALDLGARLCAGGVLALTAIARPADPHRGSQDYLLLIQERSGRVLNAAGRLAVIPKAFHRPLADHRADARIGATLRRELEKELFGRADVDNTAGGQRAADPMHPRRLSAPMRWLTEHPERLRMECTGFGVNLVSGNYEFASLVVIDDEEFWPRFGGDIEANWESVELRQYSTLDAYMIGGLIADESWSNEGLFALLQGLRRLVEIGGDRVKIPAVELCC
jgi:transcriptional regulator with XRE-family HTH domain